MPRFSPSDAALEGFRLTWERPWAVLAWTLVRFAATVSATAAFLSLGGAGALRVLNGAAEAQTLAPEAAEIFARQAFPSFLVFLLLALAGYAVIYAGVLRSVLRPQDRRFASLRLSIDEALQLGLAVLVMALLFAYVFVSSLLVSLAALASEALGAAGGFVQSFVLAATMAGLLVLVVRLSLAAPTTFVRRRISLFSSAELTGGLFWPLFGAYALAAVLTLVVLLLAAVIFFLIVWGVFAAVSGPDAALPTALGLVRSTAVSVGQLFAPGPLVNQAFNAFATTLGFVILCAPSAAVFRALGGLEAAPPAGGAAAQPAHPWR